MVEDTGFGIKREDYKNIFTLFNGTADSFKVNKSSAHGFGLYISREITKMLTAEGDVVQYFFLQKNYDGLGRRRRR